MGDGGEGEEFVGCEIEVVWEDEVGGYRGIGGGWKKGKGYRVYLYGEREGGFVEWVRWKGKGIREREWEYECGEKRGGLLGFAKNEKVVELKVGICLVSMEKAKMNGDCEIGEW